MMTDSPLQDARAVAYRAFCLGALLKRAELESTVLNLDDYHIAQEVQQRIFVRYNHLNARLRDWLMDEALYPHLFETEKALLQRPMGTWSRRDILLAYQRTGALGVLLWALQMIETLPPFDTPFDTNNVLKILEIYTPTIDVLWRAELRDTGELRGMRDRAELWNWRSRATELQRMGVRPPKGVSFAEIIYLTARKAHENGKLPLLIHGDFPAFNKAYVHLDEYEYSIVSSIAEERYFALNWLCEPDIAWEHLLTE